MRELFHVILTHFVLSRDAFILSRFRRAIKDIHFAEFLKCLQLCAVFTLL